MAVKFYTHFIIRGEKDALRDKLEELKQKGEGLWNDLKNEIDASMTALESSYEELKNRLQQQ